MDKQYKLTDRVSKDSIKSPIFKNWVKRILCIACIISLALQLTLCCMPIKASAAATDSIVGTWILNETLDLTNSSSNGLSYTPNGAVSIYYSNDGNNTLSNVERITIVGGGGALRIYTGSNPYTQYYNKTATQSSSTSGSGQFIMWRLYSTSGYTWKLADKTSDVGIKLRTIVVNTEFDNWFSEWLYTNATKVVTDVYDFTGETRLFNDELTLFNTSDATFTNSFNFNFEVLGVGTADYIILQRTTQNKYTMSYSFDFEDSGGLTMIYRDSPPFDNGDAEWLGGKVNRKVITFLTNPEDPEFQQWLLDNTTLFDNVKDAYQLGQQSGYNNGYEEGFANSLIGDSLSGPINALSQITLIEIQGTAITLGGVVMTAIALCLVLAFLKLYAGG